MASRSFALVFGLGSLFDEPGLREAQTDSVHSFFAQVRSSSHVIPARPIDRLLGTIGRKAKVRASIQGLVPPSSGAKLEKRLILFSSRYATKATNRAARTATNHS